ncbi:MAG TPA: fibronectin type III domain-containing protein [Thermoanaerobaculia bacterium]|jgi:fibronectin type 3 domain-containing protein
MSRFSLVPAALIAILCIPAQAAQTPLITERSLWKYLDNGSNQGTAWTATAFDDSLWASGPAELGYGDGDEATIVNYGPDPLRRYVTTYFRKTVNVEDPSQFTKVILRLIRDDGAVVYINGREVWRPNMPTGTIAYTTLAAVTVSDADEDAWQELTLDPQVLVAGANTVAVEMHQAGRSSSDLSFDLQLIGEDNIVVPALTRGPYLQMGTPTSMIVRWRTDTPSDSRVRFGSILGSLTSVADDLTPTTDHTVVLTGLTPGTKYYYSIGTTAAKIAGNDGSYSFVTSPRPGTATDTTRVWVLGDSGTGGPGAAAVRGAYYKYAGPTATNLWLMLGDNAYDNGLDYEYQNAVFNTYPEMLRAAPLWPTIGNHDTAQATTYNPSIAYYDIFNLPTRGEAGGVPSGTESYYSFDYGNIHFICLDSMTSDRSPTGPMLTWLRNDLAVTSATWIIAYWHHPPYSKGSHDSDRDYELIEMRQNALPILEAAGVDLVLSGHSHAYERSYLIDGHYGYSTTFTSSMKINGGDGRVEGTGAYQKPTGATHAGAVYAVAGSGAVTGGGLLNHPAMFISLNNLGSMVLEVNGNRLDAKFLRETGAVADSFTILKGASATGPNAPTAVAATALSSTSANVIWTDNSTDESGFRIERCSGTGCTTFARIADLSANTTTFTDTALTATTTYRYRVVAYNSLGASASAPAEVTTASATLTAPAALVAAAVSGTQVHLVWTDTTTNEDGFRIERCSGAACNTFDEIARTAANAVAYDDASAQPGTLYRYRVSAFNASGLSAPSAVAEATTLNAAPAAPSSLTASAVSPTQVHLAWTDASANEDGFRIERCSGAACTSFAAIGQTAANVVAFDDLSATPGTLYRYRVFAFNAAGSSAASQIAEITTANVAPAAPSLLTATAVSPTQVHLAWTDPASNEDGFRVDRCSGAACTNFAQIAQTAANVVAYDDLSAAPGTLYRYRVFAFNAAGSSAASAIAEITTANVAPAAPASLTASAVSATQVHLAWTDAASNEDGFRIERCSGAACTSFVAVGQTAANVIAFDDLSATPGTLYRYRVFAFNAAGSSAASAVAEITTPIPPPAAPVSLTASALSPYEISLRWTDASTSESGFAIERCSGSGCTTFVRIAQTAANVTSYLDSGLTPSTL